MSRKCVVCNERPILTPEVYPGLCCNCDQDANLKRAYENIEWSARRARQYERRRWFKLLDGLGLLGTVRRYSIGRVRR